LSKITSATTWIAAAAFSMAMAGSAFAQFAPPTPATGPQPASVRVEMTDDIGPVLADPAGHTLYTWAYDKKANESLCLDTHYTHTIGNGSVPYDLPDAATRPTCQTIWPPFVAATDAKPVGAWGVFKRPDGTRQWSYDGKPLYTFIADHQPGEMNGVDGTGRSLSGRYPLSAPLDAPSGVIAQVTSTGRVLMTDKGKVLYTAKAGGGLAKAAFCASNCTPGWSALAAPAIADQPPKGWTIVDLPSGGRQWVFQGKALYTYDGDTHFGDLNGVEETGFQPATLQRPLAPPSDFTTQMSGDGPVFADRNGMTVYSYGCSDEGPDRALCDIPGYVSELNHHSICGVGPICAQTWRPVVASRDAKPVGHSWTIIMVDPTGDHLYAAPGQTDGLRVWAYRGRPVYTYAGDKDPGDINGHLIGIGGFGWGYGMLRADGGDRRGF
jgi:predicted lipoprotein with Yx(FWY)xxD motif